VEKRVRVCDEELCDGSAGGPALHRGAEIEDRVAERELAMSDLSVCQGQAVILERAKRLLQEGYRLLGIIDDDVGSKRVEPFWQLWLVHVGLPHLSGCMCRRCPRCLQCFPVRGVFKRLAILGQRVLRVPLFDQDVAPAFERVREVWTSFVGESELLCGALEVATSE
jgi:hypothetical protein